MPTVLRQDGFAVKIYTHDHEPMHVHVFKSGHEVVIDLMTIEVREYRGMKTKEVHKAQDIVASYQDFLIREWRRIGPIS